MRKLIFNCNEILRCSPKNLHFKVLNEFDDVNILNNFSIVIEDGIIVDITNKLVPDDFFKFDEVIDASEFSVLPGLIDSHTHLVFAGSRAKEYEMITKGVSYEEISKAGGGILTTVNATRECDKDLLFSQSLKKLYNSIRFGITTIEIKSGYGLNFDDEIKILEVIDKLKEKELIDIVTTFLGAHSIPKEYKNDRQEYVNLINNELLPYIKQNNLAQFCDIFTELTAFNLEETKVILSTAKSLGFKIKLHCDQFNSIGATTLGIELGASSIDHLEVIKSEEIKKLSKSEIPAILLPGVSYFLNINYAPAREIIDEGCIVVLATDFNPGSCMTQNLPLIMHIACSKMKMTINEAINSTTINAAYALGVEKTQGSIEIGKKADFIILDTLNYQDLIYYFGMNLIKYTIKNGNIIYERNY